MTSGTFPPPVPIRPVSVCTTLSSSEIFTRLSAGWFSNATAAGTTPARSVGEVSSSYPMPPDCAECSVQNPAASITHGGWCASARRVQATSSVTSIRLPPWSFRTILPVPPQPASPARSARSPAALCHARKPSAEYPDTPSDSNNISGARSPAKSATRKIRFLLWGTPHHCASRTLYAADHPSPT